MRPPSQLGPDAVPRVAGAVVDPRPRLRREERQVVGGDVDRPAPRALDPRAREPGQQPPQPRLGALRRRQVAAEAIVDAPAESDRAGAAAHEHAPVVRRAEVVEEHPRVDDRLAPGPADLLHQPGRGLRQDDVRAEVRQVARRRRPPGQRGVHREDDLARTNDSAVRLDDAVADPAHRRSLVQRRRRRRAPRAAARARAAPDGRSPRRDRRLRRGRPAKRRDAPARRVRARPPGPRGRPRPPPPPPVRSRRPARAPSTPSASRPRAARRPRRATPRTRAHQERSARPPLRAGAPARRRAAPAARRATPSSRG